MSSPNELSYTQPLSDGLTLRSCRTDEDVERVAQLNGGIHGPEVAALTRNLFLHHPKTERQDLIYVESASGEVVSTLCLIPWTWNYAGIVLPVGEMGIVGTAEAYRNRGLVRAQVDYFKRRLQARGCLVSSIQGIPYYYRQFGYEYAIPLEGGWRLELRHIPASDGEEFRVRDAILADLPTLKMKYDHHAATLEIHTVRDEAIWRYLLAEDMAPDEMVHETLVVEDAAGKALGYVRMPEHHFGTELTIDEASNLPVTAMLAVLRHAKVMAEERQKPGIRLNLPPSSAFVQLAETLGAHDMGTYAWQIHLPDIPGLLRALAPALEKRVAASPFAGLTQELHLSFYRQELVLHFQEGGLIQVSDWQKPSAKPQISLPPRAFVPLVMGYHSLGELRAMYPDVGVGGQWRLLMETLFPPGPAFIHTIY